MSSVFALKRGWGGGGKGKGLNLDEDTEVVKLVVCENSFILFFACVEDSKIQVVICIVPATGYLYGISIPN